jgi:hypothetical protein
MVWDAHGDVDIAGVGPMAEFLGVSRKQFVRIRDSDPTTFHTYTESRTSLCLSLQAWPILYDEKKAPGIERRTQNLRQYHLETLTTSGEGQGVNVGGAPVPRNVPVAACSQPKTTPLRPEPQRKTPR